MDKYDIVIQAGQSNAQGFGRGEVDVPYWPSPRVLYLSAEKECRTTDDVVCVTYPDKPFVLSIAEETVDGQGAIGDFSLTFASDYLQNGFLRQDRKLLILRAAVGGTGFSCGHWRPDGPLYRKMIEMIDYALELSDESRPVTFLWHQGEHDANRGMSRAMYQAYVAHLVTAVREHCHLPQLPFIAADFVPQWRDEDPSKTLPIVRALRNVCERIGNAAFVETDGLLSNAQKNGGRDSLHFCRQSLYEIGHRYFRAWAWVTGAQMRTG